LNTLKRFGKGSNLYTFDGQVNLSDNFGDLVTRTSRLPGTDGGFDELGDGRGLSEIGKVTAEFWMLFASPAAATAQLDTFRRMADWGVQRLFVQPTDPSVNERWCWARINAITHSFATKDMPHKRLRLKAVWQVSDPFWYGAGSGAVWGGGQAWGGGTQWGGGTPTAASGLLTTVTLTNSGNAYTYLQAAVRPGAGQSANDVLLRRIVDGQAVDEVMYTGSLAAGDNLVIDSRRREVKLNDQAVYSTLFRTANAGWLRLMPGSNTIEIRFAQTSDAASVNLRFLERWV
jgi:hypothetical protein